VIPLFSEADFIAAKHYQNRTEERLTVFSRISLIICLATAIIGIGLFLTLKYFEQAIDDFDNRPDSITQKTFSCLTTLSVMMGEASFLESQAFLLSQILNIGYYIRYGRGAIHHRHVFSLQYMP